MDSPIAIDLRKTREDLRIARTYGKGKNLLVIENVLAQTCRYYFVKPMAALL